MNKTAIKNFSIEARKKLIASVKDKAGRIGIMKDQITEPISKGEGFAIFPTYIGTTAKLSGKELEQRKNLVNKIKNRENGYDLVMEEVAYTWFNRIIAVRFMEINDYLPSRIRVLSSETKGKFEPDIVTQAPNIDLELSQQEIEEIISLKEKNEMDQLFRMLFIKQCNELGKVLPELFEDISKQNNDYTEILFDISYTNEDGVVRDLLKIDEEDFLEAVEIIGWMYQYYNTEPKAAVDAYNGKKKVPKEDVSAKTQLFTPDWIVRYMVENSVGRLWVEGRPNDNLKSQWKYYLEDAEQEQTVIEELINIKEEYRNLKLEEMKILDPCMGSGHILVYVFEVLMQIYVTSGYTERDAAGLIIANNLYGLDIDDRAYQLAYFAVMMKGRKYDRRFLTREISPNLCAIQESNGLDHFEKGAGQISLEENHEITANYLIETFKDGKEYGSVLDVEKHNYDGLLNYVEGIKESGAEDLFMSVWISNISNVLPALIKQAKILMNKYDVVLTNPPYFSGSDMSPKLSEYVKKNFPNSKSDMFAVFIEKCLELTKNTGLTAMITMHSWMFLSSYEKLRLELDQFNLVNMVHLGARAFEEISGEVVQATSFVYRNRKVNDYNSSFVRLVDYKSEVAKKEAYLERFINNIDSYTSKQENFEKIPGMPIAYWVSERFFEIFHKEDKLSKYLTTRLGMATANNNSFVRFWSEVNYDKIGLNISSRKEAIESGLKWFPYNKGGEFRRWYGNTDLVVNWENDGAEIQSYKDENTGKIRSHNYNLDYIFKKGLTWSALSSAEISIRKVEIGFLFDDKGSSAFASDELLSYIISYLNSKIASKFINVLNPTISFQPGNLSSLPFIIQDNKKSVIDELVSKNIQLSRDDWNSFETSWDFEKHPLIQKNSRISHCFAEWEQITKKQFNQLKFNEEELNYIFLDIYGLREEMTPEVEEKKITIRKADLQQDIKSLVSYAVGCMLGRYSLDLEGLSYAGGEWDDSKYSTFIPDNDNIIPITDEEYFNDDIVARLVEFVKVVYGADTLEENLDFIAEALGIKGNTSREVIRNYFLKDFYKDHLKVYQKRPIYWLFDSGKENGFKALIYIHRYNEDTVGRVRTDYLHKTQAAIENAITHCDMVLESSASASDKAKAVKQKGKLIKQLSETRIYDQAIAHIAHKRISIDLDDGVKVNYGKFQGVEVANEGKKSAKIDLLGKV
ncbi:BREX-1 system adenine-specific DNA-methyltransferase PglX [Paenibacillus sp. CMAA1364]